MGKGKNEKAAHPAHEQPRNGDPSDEKGQRARSGEQDGRHQHHALESQIISQCYLHQQ